MYCTLTTRIGALYLGDIYVKTSCTWQNNMIFDLLSKGELKICVVFAFGYFSNRNTILDTGYLHLKVMKFASV